MKNGIRLDFQLNQLHNYSRKIQMEKLLIVSGAAKSFVSFNYLTDFNDSTFFN